MSEPALARGGLARVVTPILALSEQALFAVANLLLQILLARSVSQVEFGAYTVSSTFFFVVAIVHQTCLVEPMFVFSAGRLRGAVAAYHAALRRHWSVGFSVMVMAGGSALAGVAAAFGSVELAKCMVAFALVSPIILYFWLLRRMAFVLGRIDLSAAASALYGAALLISAALVVWAAGINAMGAIVLSGLAAAIGAVFLRARLAWPTGGDAAPGDLPTQHLRYGRWALGAEMVNWALINGPILLLPIWFGLTASAELRALNLFFMPLLQVVSVASMLLLRDFAGRPGGTPDRGAVLRAFWLLLGGGGAYSAMMWLAGPRLAPLVFGDAYRMPASLLAFAGIGVTCLVAAQAFFVALRARERSMQVFVAHLSALGVMLCLLPVAIAHGIAGMLVAQAAGWVVAIVVAIVMIERRPGWLAVG